jgi:hypothetical protein
MSIVSDRAHQFRDPRIVLVVGRAGYETLSEYAGGGSELWQKLIIWGTRGPTPLRREFDVYEAWELASDGGKLSRPDLVGEHVLATTTGRAKHMRRGEDVVVVAVFAGGEIVGADLQLVGRLRDLIKPGGR